MFEPSSAGGGGGSANARYAYLVGRLRNRQITMEEATELFSIQQAMLRASEEARMAAQAAAALPRPMPTAAPAAPKAPATVAPAGPAQSDDLLLAGLLVMGVGAGMMASMARRLAAPGEPGASSDRTSRPA